MHAKEHKTVCWDQMKMLGHKNKAIKQRNEIIIKVTISIIINQTAEMPDLTIGR